MRTIPSENGHVSIYDIARVARVNPSTVSRALNNRDRIGAATKARILKIAKEMGYQPSAIARSLVTSRSNTIGVVAPYLGEMFIGKIIDGIEQTAEAHGYRVLFSTSRYDPERELMIATSFQQSRVDAVILVTTHLRNTYQLFTRTLSVPVVVVGQQDRDALIPTVAIDDAAAIRQSVEHIYRLGHRSFAYVGVPDRHYSNLYRKEAFLAAVRELSPRSGAYVLIPQEQTDLACGANALEDVRKLGATAVQCYNDLIAVGLISRALRQGLRIPGDISVVGFDDLEIASALPVALTTIHQPRAEIGQRAMEMVLELLDTGTHTTPLMEGKLIVRESTGRKIE